MTQAPLLIFALFSLVTLRLDSAHTGWIAPAWTEYLEHGPTGDRLPEFSQAGYHNGRQNIPDLPVTVSAADYGAIPNDNLDDTQALQTAIDAVQAKGGGVVFIPAGDYDLISTKPAEGQEISTLGLKVTHSGVVIRGAGSGENGTRLYQHHFISANGSDGAHSAVIRFVGSGDLSKPISVIADAKRGDRELKITPTTDLSPGQILRLTLHDPKPDPNALKAADSELAASLVAPFELTDDLGDYLKRAVTGQIIQMYEIESLPAPDTIRLKEPLRRDVLTRWQPRLQVQTMISEVGIESLSLHSKWPGGFAHHMPFPHDAKGDYKKGGPGVIRTAQEQDYDWSAISFLNVVHGWLRDVTTVNYTQDVTFSYSKNITAEKLTINGHAGHTGVTVSRAYDCLVRDYLVNAPRVHAIFAGGFASGNVFTRAKFNYGPYDEISACDTCLDFHGLAPFENLYDNIQNAYVYPGGALTYLPHAGQRNVFWNITAPEQMLRGGDSSEFFRTYAPTSSKKPNSFHEHWPRSFVIGVHRAGTDKVTIAGSSEDRADEWLTVEGLNRKDIEPASLYEAQFQRANAKP